MASTKPTKSFVVLSFPFSFEHYPFGFYFWFLYPRLQQYTSEHHGGNQSPDKSPRGSRSGSPTRKPRSPSRASPPRASPSSARNWKPASPPRGPAPQMPTSYHGLPPDAVPNASETPVSNTMVRDRWTEIAKAHFTQTHGEPETEADARSRAAFMESLCPSHAGMPDDGPRQEIPAAHFSHSAPGPVLARPGTPDGLTPGTPLPPGYVQVGERVNHYLKLLREEERKRIGRGLAPPPGRKFTSRAQ